ncbi:MAG: heme-binding domain-containing protein [Sulfuricurvum sp.]
MIKKVLFTAAAFVALIQLIRPDFTNPPVDEAVALHADPQVMNVLKTSCFDCHSNETKYPWYHNVSPVSWIMADHITKGRAALNFSEWDKIDPKTKLIRMKRGEQVVNNAMMPKHEYLMMHDEAVLNPEDKKVLDTFFEEQIKALGDPSDTQTTMSHDYSTMM